MGTDASARHAALRQATSHRHHEVVQALLRAGEEDGIEDQAKLQALREARYQEEMLERRNQSLMTENCTKRPPSSMSVGAIDRGLGRRQVKVQSWDDVHALAALVPWCPR